VNELKVLHYQLETNMAVYKMLELGEGSPTNFGYMYLCLAKVVKQTFLW